jgi:hypothetical protein
MGNTFQSEKLGITIAKHGEMVWENTKKLILGRFEGFRLPDWFIRNHHFIVNNLHDWETIEMYNIYHDCGKPDCRVVDENGKVHFPDHAKVSATVFTEYFPQFPEVANLIYQDMIMHTQRFDSIDKLHLSNKDTWTLLLTAFAEIHANAYMFGADGIESTSFKIKYKNLDRLGKKLVEKIEKNKNSYIYVFIRKDLENGSHKAVQAGHSVLEYGKHSKDSEHPSFVYLGVHDEEDLQNVMELLLNKNIQFKIFREPMEPYNNSITAVCTEPLIGEDRRVLSEFQLLRI